MNSMKQVANGILIHYQNNNYWFKLISINSKQTNVLSHGDIIYQSTR